MKRKTEHEWQICSCKKAELRAQRIENLPQVQKQRAGRSGLNNNKHTLTWSLGLMRSSMRPSKPNASEGLAPLPLHNAFREASLDSDPLTDGTRGCMSAETCELRFIRSEDQTRLPSQTCATTVLAHSPCFLLRCVPCFPQRSRVDGRVLSLHEDRHAQVCVLAALLLWDAGHRFQLDERL